jgi:hypothetical protein
MRTIRTGALALVILVAGWGVHPLLAQTAAAGQQSESGWLWLEQFAGSTNADGQVMALTSTSGYNFNSHIGVVAGLPIYFVRNSTSAGSTPSVNGVGDIFGGARAAWNNPLLNYRMSFTVTAPTGDSSKGLSTGGATYDWTHHVDRSFGGLTPFANVGLANSIPGSLFFQRQFISSGHAAHFEAGTGFGLPHPFKASVSAYDIEPWGAQTVFSSIVKSGGPPAGAGGHGRVFEVNQQTSGGGSLTRDNGFNAGLDANLASRFDLWCGFSHSIHYDLNTISFGIGVNLSDLIHHSTER